ncbi:MAG TPA: hypothetical protein VFV95_19810 [Vicinamibacterales bacterium]|nr:hypothetical protein [Vicinamibacterales bacterium]
MISRVLRTLAVATLVAAAAACSRSDASQASAPSIQLVPASGATPARIEVTGLSSAALDDLRDARLTPDQWPSLLRVAVAEDGPAMVGSYDIGDGSVRFTPAFRFDPGREYHVRFDPSVVAGALIPPVAARVGLPARVTGPTTVVERVYPTADLVPENLLRVYVEFSAPMGRKSGLEYVQLLDDRGKPIEGPFLPLDYEFWSPDHRRFTLFFDPGRVKDGILPNRQMGKPLHAGRSYTLVISREWKDGEGQPLKSEYRRVFRVGPARTKALDTATWDVTAPEAGGREPLVVSFREPLDHGLLMRALGVRLNDAAVVGDVRIEPGERRWVFTPRDPWRAATYHLLALSILEDVAGNQIGRAFEVDNFDTVDKSPDPQTVLIPFNVPAATGS